MALLHSLPLPSDTELIDFKLPGTDGRDHSPADYADKAVLAVIFMCNHCPYVQAVIDRLIAIQADYANKGVQLIGINANDANAYPEDSFESMRAWAREKGINFPYLRDESQQAARAYLAQCTPDLYVFDRERKLAYHGRIDDNWQEENKVKKHDLREALDALWRGEKPAGEQHPGMGCSIKWKQV